MSSADCLQRVVVLREVRKQILNEIQHLATLTHSFESQKWEGAIIGLNVIRRWIEREIRKMKSQHNDPSSPMAAPDAAKGGQKEKP